MHNLRRISLVRRAAAASVFTLIIATVLAIVSRPGRTTAGSGGAATGQATPGPLRPDLFQAGQKKLAENYGKLPLSFEANRGQSDRRVKFLSRGPGYTLFLTADEAVLKLQSVNADAGSARSIPDGSAKSVSPAVLRMKLVGANHAPSVSPLAELPGRSNYFIGNDPRKWRTNVPNYSRVNYHQAYPGVDLVYYGNARQLEYDFVVAPGSDPNAITLDVAAENAETRNAPLRIAENGDLVVGLPDREIRFNKPVVYQVDSVDAEHRRESSSSQGKHSVDGRWVLKQGNQVGFELGAYDRSRTLVIDPALSYCTYLGGSIDNSAYNVSADAAGNAYITGTTSSTDFPTKNAFQAANAGNTDVFVARLNPTGTVLTYATYLGGSGQDYAFWVTVDGLGQAHVVGSTSSANFPVTAGVLQTTCGGGCVGGARNSFVTVLNSKGSALIYSTYLGGTHQDQANAITLDSNSNSYIVGWTTSPDFPTTTGAFQTSYSGTSDAFVAKLNPKGTALIYSTLLGVSNDNRGFGIGLDTAGDAYIAGFTTSTGFPTTPGAFQAALKGASNAFVTELDPTATALVYSTYLGGSGSDIAWGVALDSSNNAYLAGQTSSADFPTTPGALRTVCSSACSKNDIFVTKVNPTGSGLVYSTYLGGVNGEQEAYAIAVGASGNAVVTGRTRATDFPTTKGAFLTTDRGGFDSYVAELNTTGSALSYSSYFGGSLTETGLGVAVDAPGNIYLVGRTYSPDFPVTPKSIQTQFAGTTQSYVAKFVAGDQAWPLSLGFGSQPVGTTSAAMTTTLTNSETTALTITSVKITGAGAANFAISSNTCGASLAAGASCAVSATFTPTAIGSLTALLTITDAAANSPQNVALAGTGTSNSLTLTPTSMAFATQVVGTTSPSQPATLANNGATAATITKIVTSSQFRQTNDCTATLAPGASCTINVVFLPNAAGTQKGTLTVTDNVLSPLTVALTGSGTVMSDSPTSLNFGNQAKGTSSAPQAITVKNTGAAAVTITKLMITGARVTSFSQTNDCPISPATLAAGATCTVNVVFIPQLKGALTANVAFFDSGGGSPQIVPLSGNGT